MPEIHMNFIRFSALMALLALAQISWSSAWAADETLEGELQLASPKDCPFVSGDRIVFLGDSITWNAREADGFITLLYNTFTAHPEIDVKLFNAGISGHTVPDCQERLERDVISLAPTIVFIYIGTNDVWHSLSNAGTPVDKYEAGLRDLISRLRDRGVTVVLATPGVIGEKRSGNQLDTMLDQYCEVSRKVAADMGITLCDLRKAFVDYEAANNPTDKESGVLTVDKVHLSPDGNALVAKMAAKSIVEALKAEPLVPHITSCGFLDSRDATILIHTNNPPAGLTINYTTDASDPTASSPAYSQPIKLTKTTTIRARTFVNGQPSSPVVSATSTLIVPDPAATVAAPSSGLTRLFYDGHFPSMPDFSKLSATETKVTQGLDFANLPKDHDLALQFNGYIKVPQTGFYDFSGGCNTMSEVYIDDRLVIRGNEGTVPNIPLTRTALEAGLHAVSVRFNAPWQTSLGFLLVIQGPDHNRHEITKDDYFH